MLDFSTLEPFDVDTPCVGIFFFLPYILESNILDVLKRCQLPSSSDIDAVSACLPMLLLKLMGCHRLSHIGRYEHALAPQLFRKFIDMPGRIIYDGHAFQIKIRKRAHTPILMEVEKLQKPIPVPWLEGKTVEIIWTA